MRINPYLFFNGNCEAAFKFYEKCFGGKIEMMLRAKDTPAAAQMPADFQEKIMHARLVVGDQVLMGGDAPAGRFNQPQGFSVSLTIDDPKAAERVFNGLAAKGTVNMPFEETFWALRFGMVLDEFGIPWMVNCEKPA